MEIGLLQNALFSKHLLQLPQKCLQKETVFLSGCLRFPAEQPLQTPLFFSHDFGSRHRAPLAEQMGNFEVDHPFFSAEPDPAKQLFKTETVAVPSHHRHIHQLHGGSLSSDRRIKGRGKYRRQDHVAVIPDCRTDKRADQVPVFFGKHGYLIILGERIYVKPLRMANRKFRQNPRENLQPDFHLRDRFRFRKVEFRFRKSAFRRRKSEFPFRKVAFCQHFRRQKAEGRLPVQLHPDFITACRRPFRHIHIQPERPVLPRDQGKTLFRYFPEKIRIQTGLCPVIVLIPFRMTGIGTGHQIHLSDAKAGGSLLLFLATDGLCFCTVEGGLLFFPGRRNLLSFPQKLHFHLSELFPFSSVAIGNLNGNRFFFERHQTFFRHLLWHLIRINLDQR